jgi:hypothetical protein
MRRREYLRAAAVLLGVSAATTGSGAADDDLYDEVVAAFDDVTELRAPDVVGDRTYLRLYDAEREVLAYVTALDRGSTVSVATRDASDVDLAT